MTTIAGILVILAVYGWYMHNQGRKVGFIRGASAGALTVACTMVHKEKMTRREVLNMFPMFPEEQFDEIMDMVKNAPVQPKK